MDEVADVVHWAPQPAHNEAEAMCDTLITPHRHSKNPSEVTCKPCLGVASKSGLLAMLALDVIPGPPEMVELSVVLAELEPLVTAAAVGGVATVQSFDLECAIERIRSGQAAMERRRG